MIQTSCNLTHVSPNDLIEAHKRAHPRSVIRTIGDSFTEQQMKPVGFDWDDEKAAASLAKHGVSFEEAMSAFDDPLGRFREDPDHSVGEKRQILAGYSAAGRLLLVSFTERGDLIRIINARPAMRGEKRHHEETRQG